MSRRRSMLLGMDAVVTLVIVSVLTAVAPQDIPVSVAQDVYGMSASVLSIIFSVFTAALAVIMSSPEDKFAQFLETEGLFGDLIWGYIVTLLALFAALVYSMAAFGWTSYQAAIGIAQQHKAGSIAGVALVTYGLGATLTSTVAAMRYVRKRAEFTRLTSR